MEAVHHVAHAVDGTVAFRTWEEARASWEALVSAFPGALAVVVMPDHVHLVHPEDVHERLGRVLRGYARWRNRRRSEGGAVWRRQPAPPCRAGMVADPLAYPFTSYRDAVGLAVGSPLGRAHEPDRLHRWVCRDDDVGAGSELPCRVVLPEGAERVWAVEAAVSEALRVPRAALRKRGTARTLFGAALLEVGGLSTREAAAARGVGARAVRDIDPARVQGLEVVRRVAGDPQFPGLADGDVLALPAFRRWRRPRPTRRWPELPRPTWRRPELPPPNTEMGSTSASTGRRSCRSRSEVRFRRFGGGGTGWEPRDGPRNGS